MNFPNATAREMNWLKSPTSCGNIFLKNIVYDLRMQLWRISIEDENLETKKVWIRISQRILKYVTVLPILALILKHISIFFHPLLELLGLNFYTRGETLSLQRQLLPFLLFWAPLWALLHVLIQVVRVLVLHFVLHVVFSWALP